MTFKALNLGCGQRFHPDWVNVNFISSGEGVISADLNQGIPFSDASFDVVYHSHLLEHFSKSDALIFMRECFRVLRPGGLLRVAVPDLEAIVRAYLHWLEQAREHAPEADHNHTWMVLEMYDQVVRNYSGGEMAKYAFQDDIPNEAFIVERCGIELKRLMDEGRARAGEQRESEPSYSTLDRIKCLGKFFLQKSFRKEFLLRRLLKNEYKALEIGRFRLSGENHQWMYDSLSLAMLLTDAGFVNVMRQTAMGSYHDQWPSYHLDTEPDGSVYKPDSLFMEARRP